MGSTKKKNNFLIQGSILAAAGIISRLIGLIYRIPLNNIIGDEGIGLYSLAYDLYSVALLLSSYSLPLAVSKLVAVRIGRKEYRNSYRIFACAMSLAVVVGTIASAILFFGADFFADVFFDNPRAAIPLKVLAPTILVFAIMGVLRGYFQGKNTMLPTSISQILEQVFNAIVSIAGAYFLMKSHSASANIAAYGAAGGTLGTLMGAVAGALFLGFIYMIYRPYIKKQIRRDVESKPMADGQIYKLLLLTIVPIILSQTVYQISGLIDSSLFHKVMGSKGLIVEERDALLGIYSGKYKLLSNVPISIASAMSVAIIPTIAGALAAGSYREIRRKIKITIKFNMIIAIPAAMGMGVLAGPIIQLLFPGSSADATKLMQVGAIAIVFYALSTISNGILQGINRLQVPVYNATISLVIHVIIVFILLKFTDMGVYALVIGNILFALGVSILNWIAIAKELDYKQEIIKTFAIPSIASVVMGIVAYLTYQGIYGILHSNTISVVIAIFIAIIVYFVAILLMKGIEEDELLSIPKGRTLVYILKKFRIL